MHPPSGIKTEHILFPFEPLRFKTCTISPCGEVFIQGKSQKWQAYEERYRGDTQSVTNHFKAHRSIKSEWVGTMLWYGRPAQSLRLLIVFIGDTGIDLEQKRGDAIGIKGVNSICPEWGSFSPSLTCSPDDFHISLAPEFQ